MFSTIRVFYLWLIHGNSWILNSMRFKATSKAMLQVSSYSKRAKGKKNYKFNLAGQKNGTKILEKWKYGSVEKGWQWVSFD